MKRLFISAFVALFTLGVSAKKDMLDKNESLRSMYNENDDNTIVLYMRNATATISSFTSDPETFTF